MSTATPPPSARAHTAVLILVGVALLAVILGIYQWNALYEMRTSGATPACAVSENIDCASVWNSPLAAMAHRYTGLPFAAWGVAWGLLLLISSFILMRRLRSAQPDGDIVPALRLITGVGAILSVALLVYSLTIGVFCPTCVLFYVFVAIAVYIAFARLPSGAPQWNSALLHSGGWLLIVFGLLLYPGLHTPKQDLATATLHKLGDVPVSTADLSADPLANFIKSLSPEVQQVLSDARAIYRTAPYIESPVDKNRLLFGNPDAPVHLVDWVDIRCPHCRNLDEALTEIRAATPADSWSEEGRHFPLDSECNRNVHRSDGSGVACLGAKLLICLSGSPKGNTVRSALFDNQRNLTTSQIWQLAASDAEQRASMEKCVSSPQTAAALQRDVQLAVQYGIEGTPLVVINGRQAPAFPPFIYAMIIAAGDSNAAGFRLLPPPRPESLEKR